MHISVLKLAQGLVCATLAAAVLAGCQTDPKANVTNSGSGKSASLRAMEQVAIAAHKCWFASKDSAFRSYRFANELSSYSGNPRFLLVPVKNYGGLPLLVARRQFLRRQGLTPPFLNPGLNPGTNADSSGELQRG